MLEGSAVGLLLTGAALGAVALAVLVALSRFIPSWRGNSGIPIAGLVLSLPMLVVDSGVRPSATALLGLALLVLAGAWPLESRELPVRVVASIPGTALLTVGTPSDAAVLVALGVPVLVAALTVFEEGHDYEPGLAGMCAAIAGGGAFLTVPDTEHMALIAGAGVAVGVATFAVPKVGLGLSGPVWVGAFLWAVAIDGEARMRAIVGAVGALALLAIDPAVRTHVRIRRGLLTYLPAQSERHHLVMIAVAQTVLAVFSARVAGFAGDVTLAIVLVLAAWSGAGWLLVSRARAQEAQGPR